MYKILIVEDTAVFRELIGEILELENFQTIVAENGREGIELAIKESPDLILSDIIMPEIDGNGLLTALRKHPKTANIPLIFLTVKMLPKDSDLDRELGVDYLTKPFTCQELLSAIYIQLERSKTNTNNSAKV